MKKYGFGVDIGGTTVKMGFFDMSGSLLDKWEIPTNTENNGASILDDVAEAIKLKMTEKQIGEADVEGIGIDVPGPVADDGTVFKCVNLGWGVFNVTKALEEKTGLKVRTANDANAATLGEMWQGAAKGHSNVVMLTLGTGVGGGIIINGKIVNGPNGAAGELGHIPVDENEQETCGCGKKGCLEQYASATGIARLARRRLAEDNSVSTLREIENPTAKDVFDAAKAGDVVAYEIVDRFSKILGRAMAGIACVADPEVFVIGGGVSKAGKILTENLVDVFVPNAFHACRSTKIVLAELGNDAGIYGCARMLID
ncbi:MAG: ROK family glucokinase [Eubacterium sp.]|nr:ROK family glucokinase [Eubacterium sp.]